MKTILFILGVSICFMGGYMVDYHIATRHIEKSNFSVNDKY